MGDEGLVPYCEACHRPFFGVSHPCVIVVVVNEQREVVLIRQNRLSAANWVLVAGYIKPGETVEDCVTREVFEETGLTPLRCDYLSSYHHGKRDLLMLGFVARVLKVDFAQSQEVEAIGWFGLEHAGRNLRADSIGEKVFLEACRRVTCASVTSA
jgi:NAD+ diphosphatase